MLTSNPVRLPATFPGQVPEDRTTPNAISITKWAAGGRSALPYFLYVPQNVNPLQPVLVAVHGISRNARKHAEVFAPLADATGRILVVPIFDAVSYRRYQRIGRDDCRADEALKDVLRDVTRRTKASTRWVDLFGFSAGAQFAHRFAMLNPKRVAHLMICSAGWYTLPDTNALFPYGTSPESSRGRRIGANFERFLAIPMLVIVGERDVNRDRRLRKEEYIDLVQGPTRVERAGRWASRLRELSASVGVQSDITSTVLPRCTHSFHQCVHRGELVERIREWLDHRPTLIRDRFSETPSMRSSL